MNSKIKKIEGLLEQESQIENKLDLMNALSYEIRRVDRNRSLKLCEEAYGLSRSSGYEKGIAESLFNMATHDNYSGNYEEALNKCNEALGIMEKLELTDSTIRAFNTKGFSYTRLGQGELGLEFFQKGLELARQADNAYMAVYFLCNIGDSYGLMNMHQDSLYWFFEAFKVAEAISVKEQVRHELHDSLFLYIAEAYRKLGQLDEATEYAQKGIEKAESTKDKVFEAHCYYVSGKVFRDKQEIADALNRLNISLNLFHDIHYTYNQGEVLADIAEIYKNQGDMSQAVFYLEQALEIAADIKAMTLERNIHKALAEIHEVEHDYKKALSHYKVYLKLNEALLGEIQEKKLKAIVSVQKLEQAEKDAEIYRLRNIELKEASDRLMEQTVQLEESRKSIEYISEIGRKITATLDVELIVNTIYENMNQMVDAPIFGLGLYDKETDSIDYRVFIELGERIPRYVAQMDEERSFATRCIRSKMPYICNSVEHTGDERSYLPVADIALEDVDPLSVIYIPLIIEDEVIGIYTVQSYKERAYSERDVEMLVALSSFIAIALNNHLKSEALKMTAAELSEALEHLRNTQTQLINSEKMAALGQLISGVAHEINTPLGAIQASINNISEYTKFTILDKLPSLLNILDYEEYQLFKELLKQTVEKNETISLKDERMIKKELIRQFKEYGVEECYEMADNMIDMGIYQNIEEYKPLIVSPHSHLILQVCYEISGIFRNTNNMRTAVSKASKMLYALKNYAHFDSSDTPVSEDVFRGLETVLELYLHNIKQGTEVIKRYGEIPPVKCFPDELNQVWTNLIHNALQAMDYSGRLQIETKRDGEFVVVEITDDGMGIPQEIQSRVFDSFFTTKAQGEGSGLGLSISKQIIEKHNGEITFTSVPGQTTFSVRLPISG